MNANFETNIRGLQSDIFDRDQVQNPFRICSIQLQKKKSGVKNVWKFVPLRGGSRRIVAISILNFHFEYLNPSLILCLVCFNARENFHPQRTPFHVVC